MLLKHLLQLLGVESARTVVVELKEHIFDVILRLQLHFRLHIEIFGCIFVTG